MLEVEIAFISHNIAQVLNKYQVKMITFHFNRKFISCAMCDIDSSNATPKLHFILTQNEQLQLAQLYLSNTPLQLETKR